MPDTFSRRKHPNALTIPCQGSRVAPVGDCGKSVARFTWREMHGNGTHEFSRERLAAFLATQASRGKRSWETLTLEQSSERHRAIALTKHGDPEGARLAQAQTMAANGKTPQQVRAVGKYSASQSRRIVAAQFPKRARIAARRAEVTRLRANGRSVTEIAARHEVTVPTIYNDIKAMSDRD